MISATYRPCVLLVIRKKQINLTPGFGDILSNLSSIKS
jgi:hypothetical protein